MLRDVHPGCPSASSVQISASSLLCSLLQPLAVSIPVPVVLWCLWFQRQGAPVASLSWSALAERWCLSPVCGLSSAELLLRERDAKLRRSHGVCELHL